jgi:hypothetical protein
MWRVFRAASFGQCRIRIEMNNWIEFGLHFVDASEMSGNNFYGRKFPGANAFCYLRDRWVLQGGHVEQRG